MAAALSLNKGKRDGEEVKAKQPARAMIIAQLEREIKEHLITTNKVNIRRSVALRQLTERLTDQEAVLKMEQAAMESLPSRHHLDVFAPPAPSVASAAADNHPSRDTHRHITTADMQSSPSAVISQQETGLATFSTAGNNDDRVDRDETDDRDNLPLFPISANCLEHKRKNSDDNMSSSRKRQEISGEVPDSKTSSIKNERNSCSTIIKKELDRSSSIKNEYTNSSSFDIASKERVRCACS